MSLAEGIVIGAIYSFIGLMAYEGGRYLLGLIHEPLGDEEE